MKKSISILLSMLIVLSGFQFIPINAETTPSASEIPEMPEVLKNREAKNFVYDLNDDWDEMFYKQTLIMPGDTFEFPVKYNEDGSRVNVVYADYPFFIGERDSYDPSYYGVTEGFEIEGTIDVIEKEVKTFTGDSGSKTMTFYTKFKNNTNCPITLSYKGSGSGPLAGKYTQGHLCPKVNFYSPYFAINFPTYEDGTDRTWETEEGQKYFWQEGELDTLDFPKYYWLTDIPYTLRFPNPTAQGQHFEKWGNNEQVNHGAYSELTVCWKPHTYTELFAGYGEKTITPSFTYGNTLTLVGNGGKINDRGKWVIEVPEHEDTSDSYGYDLSVFVPKKDGDTFLGWCEKETALYTTFVTKDSEADIYNKYWKTYSYNTDNITLYAKWESDTYYELEQNGWQINDDDTLWLLNNSGAEAWTQAKKADPTLAAKIKDVKTGYKDEDVGIIPYACFENCTGLTEVTFGKNTNINSYYTFRNCTNLKKVTVNSDYPYYALGSNMFWGTDKDLIIQVPEEKLAQYLDYYKNFGYSYLFNADPQEERYCLTVNGEVITSKNLTVKCGEGTAVFDPSTATLTLENATLSIAAPILHYKSIFSNEETYEQYRDAAIISDLPKLNLVLKGKNVIDGTDYAMEFFRAYGDINITGDGSIEGFYVSKNQFVQEGPDAEKVPYSGITSLSATAMGDVNIQGVNATRLLISPNGKLTINNSKLNGGQFTAAGDVTAVNSEFKNFVFEKASFFDKGEDAVIGAKEGSLALTGCKLDTVKLTCTEGTKGITLTDCDIQLTGKLEAGENTKLNIVNTKFTAYGQADGVTNIAEKNITLTDCELIQGSWTERGYFSIKPTQPATDPTKPTEPSVTTPTATEPTVTEPTATEPIVTEPTATEPTVTEPAATEPTVTEPTATEPQPTEPTATEPTTKKTTVKLGKTSASLYVKQTVKISATVKNGKGKTTYKSNNKKVAKVSAKGVVTALKKGTAKITVTNNGVKKIFTVKVKNPKLNKTKITLKKGKSFTLKITGKVGTAKFTTSKKSVATVNKNGKITAKKKGKAIITVKTNGITLKATVTVK